MIGNAYNVLLMLLTAAAIVETHKQILLKHTNKYCWNTQNARGLWLQVRVLSAETRAPKLAILAKLTPSTLDEGVTHLFMGHQSRTYLFG